MLRFQDIPRCQVLLTHMLHLSLNLPPTSTPLTLLRARATSLSFSLLPPSESGTGGGNATDDYDEEDQYEDEPEPKGRPDPDVLPTILAYRDGELERTWVRVDWELKEDGVEGLLRRWVALRQVARRTAGAVASRANGKASSEL